MLFCSSNQPSLKLPWVWTWPPCWCWPLSSSTCGRSFPPPPTSSCSTSGSWSASSCHLLRWAFLNNPQAFVKPVESFSSKVVLLAAKEYNREDYDGQELRDSGQGIKPVNKITCENNEILDTRNSTERSENEIGSNDSEKNVETAWTSRSMSTAGRKKAFFMSWYKIFEVLGNILHVNNLLHIFSFGNFREEGFPFCCFYSFYRVYGRCCLPLPFSCRWAVKKVFYQSVQVNVFNHCTESKIKEKWGWSQIISTT